MGLLIDREEIQVTRVGICLDCTPDTAKRAVQAGVHLIAVHHPLIYHPLKRLGTDPVSRAVTTLLKADIALYAMHTNWDRAAGGINDTLAECLELTRIQPLGMEGEAALPRIGNFGLAAPAGRFCPVCRNNSRGARERAPCASMELTAAE